MKTYRQSGFTIIEIMLFLGVSAFLVMAILTNTGNSVNVQRYKDSVTSLFSFFQQQYSDVSNVSNDTDTNDCGGVYSRGQSDCVILGKYITTNNDGRSLLVKTVIGTIPSTESIRFNSSDEWNDLTVFSYDENLHYGYNARVSSVSDTEYKLEWGASVVKPKSNEAMHFSLLILRSPVSGAIKTFSDSENIVSDKDILSLINYDTLRNTIKTCVNSNGLFTGMRMAVIVIPNSTSTSGIQTLGDDSGC